jgi:hypothetical protein
MVMPLELTRPRLTRRVLVIAGASGLFAAAGTGSYVATHASAASPTVHATTVAAPVNAPASNAPEPASTAPDTDNVQDASGSDPATAPGSPAAAGTEKPGAETEAASDGPGGYADLTPSGQPDANATTDQQGEH